MWPWNYSISGKKLSQEQCVESLMECVTIAEQQHPSHTSPSAMQSDRQRCKAHCHWALEQQSIWESNRCVSGPTSYKNGRSKKFMYAERQVTQWFLSYMISVMSLKRGSKHLSMHTNTEVEELISHHKKPLSYMFQISLLSNTAELRAELPSLYLPKICRDHIMNHSFDSCTLALKTNMQTLTNWS